MGGAQHGRRPVGQENFSRRVRKRAVFQTRHVRFIGLLAFVGKRQVAAADKLNFGMVFGCPIASGNIRRLSLGRTGQRRYRKQRRERCAGASKNPNDSHVPLPICLSAEPISATSSEAIASILYSTLAFGVPGKKGFCDFLTRDPPPATRVQDEAP